MKWSGHLVLPSARVIRNESDVPESKSTTDVATILSEYDIEATRGKFKNHAVRFFEGDTYHYTAVIGEDSHYGINVDLIEKIVGNDEFVKDGYIIEHLATVFNDNLAKDALSDGGNKNLYFEATPEGREQDKVAYEVYGPFYQQENDNVTQMNL